MSRFRDPSPQWYVGTTHPVEDRQHCKPSLACHDSDQERRGRRLTNEGEQKNRSPKTSRRLHATTRRRTQGLPNQAEVPEPCSEYVTVELRFCKGYLKCEICRSALALLFLHLKGPQFVVSRGLTTTRTAPQGLPPCRVTHPHDHKYCASKSPQSVGLKCETQPKGRRGATRNQNQKHPSQPEEQQPPAGQETPHEQGNTGERDQSQPALVALKIAFPFGNLKASMYVWTTAPVYPSTSKNRRHQHLSSTSGPQTMLKPAVTRRIGFDLPDGGQDCSCEDKGSKDTTRAQDIDIVMKLEDRKCRQRVHVIHDASKVRHSAKGRRTKTSAEPLQGRQVVDHVGHHER